jgi:ABC-2 type transport system ATP-binding protein
MQGVQRQLILEVSGLSQSYGQDIVLHDINLRVPDGAVGLLGPNGAGKTTLIRTLIGLMKPDAGTASVLGIDISVDPLEVRRRIGVMPEDDCHIPGMNAISFVAYAGELSGMNSEDAMGRAHEVLHYVGLGEARYRDIESYSVGMKQRAKLAQALVHDPELLFLDEPTNGMDPKGRGEMLALIEEITQKKGISVIVSSHLLGEVRRLCDVVVIMKAGTIASRMSLKELKDMYQRGYHVRIRGNAESFESELAGHGATIEKLTDGSLRAYLPEGHGPKLILETALSTKTQVRHMVHLEKSLEDAFMAAVKGGE